MKRMACFVFSLLTAAVILDVSAELVTTNNVPLQKMSLKAQRRKARIVAEGGLLAAPATGRVVRVVCTQTRIDNTTITRVVKSLNDQIRIPFVVTEDVAKGGNAMGMIEAAFKLPQTGVVIGIVDDPKTPTLLLAPENGWVVINVGKLLWDHPLEGVISARLTKEMWRAAALVLGCYQSMQKECVMRVISSLHDLDAEPWLVASPEPYNKMHMTAQRLGIEVHRVCTYRRACEEGWAPPPANDTQKAIWAKVKEDRERGPTNPIRIPRPSEKK